MKNSRLPFLALTLLLCPAAALLANGLELSRDASKKGGSGLASIYTGDRQKNYLVREFVPSQERLVLEFFIRIDNSFVFGQGRGHDIVQIMKARQKKPVASIKMVKANDDGGRLEFRVRNGGKNKKIKTKLSIPRDEWVRITIDFITASSPGGQDGSLEVFKNQEQKHFEASLDNHDQPADSLRLGQVKKSPAGWFGEVYFDELVIRQRP